MTLLRCAKRHMTGLENDEYVRKTDGYLPTAEVAFIDEIFKANSAILNALLTLLNERLFDNGNERYAVPLLCLVRACRLRILCIGLMVGCWQTFAGSLNAFVASVRIDLRLWDSFAFARAGP